MLCDIKAKKGKEDAGAKINKEINIETKV